jgi:hypothetical protein
MAGKGSAISRAIKYFEEADLREARAAFQIVVGVMNERAERSAQVPPQLAKKFKKTRKPSAATSQTPGSGQPGIPAEVREQEGESLANA